MNLPYNISSMGTAKSLRSMLVGGDNNGNSFDGGSGSFRSEYIIGV